MADEKIPALIERLLELTNQGKIGWEETADESTFQAAVGQYVVQVKRQPDETVEWGYSIQITDRFGRLLDESTTAPPLSKTGEAGTLLDQLG